MHVSLCTEVYVIFFLKLCNYFDPAVELCSLTGVKRNVLSLFTRLSTSVLCNLVIFV